MFNLLLQNKSICFAFARTFTVLTNVRLACASSTYRRFWYGEFAEHDALGENETFRAQVLLIMLQCDVAPIAMRFLRTTPKRQRDLWTLAWDYTGYVDNSCPFYRMITKRFPMQNSWISADQVAFYGAYRSLCFMMNPFKKEPFVLSITLMFVRSFRADCIKDEQFRDIFRRTERASLLSSSKQIIDEIIQNRKIRKNRLVALVTILLEETFQSQNMTMMNIIEFVAVIVSRPDTLGKIVGLPIPKLRRVKQVFLAIFQWAALRFCDGDKDSDHADCTRIYNHLFNVPYEQLYYLDHAAAYFARHVDNEVLH